MLLLKCVYNISSNQDKCINEFMYNKDTATLHNIIIFKNPFKKLCIYVRTIFKGHSQN